MKISREVKIGIIVTAGLAVFIYGFNFLKGKNLFSTQRKFYAVYSNIDNLVEANPVQINGFKIGQVSDISIYPDNSGRIVVTFIVTEKEVKIPTNSIAQIISSDLLGSKAIQIMLGNESEFAQSGDTLHSGIEAGLKESVDKRIAPLQKKTEGLISSIDSVMIVIQAILNEGTRENLTQSFSSIQKAIKSFETTALRLDTLVASEKTKLEDIFSSIHSITANFQKNNDKLTNVITNFSNISDSLAKANIASTINNANSALSQASSIIEKINKGEGSMGMLINNDTLYKKLEASSNDLDKLLNDLRINPSRYLHFSIFGRRDKNKPVE